MTMLEDEEQRSGSFEMVPPGTNNAAITPRRTLEELASSVVHSFDRHPESNDPNAELTLTLDKTLKAYHSQLIALGSSIGTGLFIASGAGLAIAGPIPLLIAFSFVGFTLCPTIYALGEMATFLPYPGGFIIHSKTFIDDAWGAAVGWNYALQWLLTVPLELIAAAMTLQYWGNPVRHQWLWLTLFITGIAIINISGVKGYANVEAGLSIMKAIAIVGFIIVGVFIDLGLGFEGKAVGVENWYNPGATHNGWVGFINVLVMAAFAYSGSEMVGLTASEQERPRRDMPKAISKVFWRIGIFYMVSIFLIGLLVPYNDKNLPEPENAFSATSQQSPFVIALENAGIKVLPGIMNSAIFITVLSVANSSVYGSSRVLNAMADAGLAPKAFAYIDRMGRPLRCFYVALAFGLLTYLAQIPEHDNVFFWLLSLTGLSAVMNWLSICITHIRFRKALEIAEIDLDDLPFRSPVGTIGSWVGILCNSFIIVIQFLAAVFPVDYKTQSPSKRTQAFFSSIMSFLIITTFGVMFKYFAGTKIEGVEWKWEREGRKGFVIDERGVRIVWGEGTTVVDLSTINFDGDMWTLDHYYVWARANLEMVGMRELWFVPESWRKPIKRLYFPWR